MTKKSSEYDKQYREYQKALEDWQARKPASGDNYAYEVWLEQKPQPPRRVRGLSYNDQ